MKATVSFTIDAKSVYWQEKIEDENQKKTVYTFLAAYIAFENAVWFVTCTGNPPTNKNSGSSKL